MIQPAPQIQPWRFRNSWWGLRSQGRRAGDLASRHRRLARIPNLLTVMAGATTHGLCTSKEAKKARGMAGKPEVGEKRQE